MIIEILKLYLRCPLKWIFLLICLVAVGCGKIFTGENHDSKFFASLSSRCVGDSLVVRVMPIVKDPEDFGVPHGMGASLPKISHELYSVEFTDEKMIISLPQSEVKDSLLVSVEENFFFPDDSIYRERKFVKIKPCDDEVYFAN